jgi:bifunctional N-acetylglucosamine-1-phosphate-uridyltransferase/glucosamine-1-phosphate-acetyltransferase GlmU-like protein
MLPFNFLRIFFLNIYWGGGITYNSKIGYFNIIDVNSIKMVNSSIGSFNRFVKIANINLIESHIGNFNSFKYINSCDMKHARIKNKNSFIGSHDFEPSDMIIKEKSLITHRHYFDLTMSIFIGNNVVFAGECSQIWTHGFNHKRIMKSGIIKLGNNIYIGSRALLVPGIEICDNVTIAAGTTVSKSVTESGCFVSSVLKKIKDF